jgi:hypothetical protein
MTRSFADDVAAAEAAAGRALTGDEQNALAGVLIVAEHLAATDPAYATRWLLTEGVTAVRRAGGRGPRSEVTR